MYDKLHFNVKYLTDIFIILLIIEFEDFSVPVVREYNSGRVSCTVIQYFVRVGRG